MFICDSSPLLRAIKVLFTQGYIPNQPEPTMDSTLFDALSSFRSPNVFNPWGERDPQDLVAPDAFSGPLTALPGPEGRLHRLRAHFAVDPVMILVGEAPGYQGCHFSGTAFTNESLLLKGSIPRMTVNSRITSRPRPWCEPSATIVWGALHELGIAERVVLWNAFAWHPFKPDNPYSNRAPKRPELDAGREVLEMVLQRFSGARVIAVGQVAAKTLAKLGHPPYAALRHPSMGGANQFRAGIRDLAAELDCLLSP